MGQAADDITTGFMCSFCGVCFEEPHGHPVACADCWEEDCGVPLATEEEL